MSAEKAVSTCRKIIHILLLFIKGNVHIAEKYSKQLLEDEYTAMINIMENVLFVVSMHKYLILVPLDGSTKQNK